jgi:carbonic anhydrase/acetyltransferase-like protein (isoleucine patch superfamily)
MFKFEAEKAHPSVFIATGAIVLGDVYLEEDVSIWFNAVLRGDTETLRIRARSNIQDLCMIHADPSFPVDIGEDCTIGHRAIVHGATVGARSLIGMGAILLNGAEIGEESIVAAGALIPQGKKFPPRSMIMGSPAKVVRMIHEEDLVMIRHSSSHYVALAKKYKAEHGD